LLSESHFTYQGDPLLVMLLGHDRLLAHQNAAYSNGAAEKVAQK
jgi:hypothetical protein